VFLRASAAVGEVEGTGLARRARWRRQTGEGGALPLANGWHRPGREGHGQAVLAVLCGH
jgi:hypothetical protein